MSRPEFERYLVKLYTDTDTLTRFLKAPYEEAQREGLRPDECTELARMDLVGLQFAARSFARKRERHWPR